MTLGLHQLLDTGFQTPRISEVLNCTFIFNVVNSYKESLLSKELESLEIVKTFRKTSDHVLKHLNTVNSITTKLRKESRKSKHKKKEISKDNIQEELNSDSDFCDVNNKFSCLKIY